MALPAKTVVVGVGISRTCYEEVVEQCKQWLDDPIPSESASAPYICVTSVHGIITAVLNPSVRSILNRAQIATPDGVPVVWAMRSFGVRAQRRVYGPTLMLKICEMAAADGRSIFLYGGRPEVLEHLRRNLLGTFPQLKLAGMYSPPFRPLNPEERVEVVRLIQDSQPGIVFVGLSTPKQEQWMADNSRALTRCILIGVGAAFDFHAKLLKQAPPWMQDAGLEWLFRLVMEPRRLWKRYLLVTPMFLPLWALQRAGLLRYPDDQCSAEHV
jgi:N-acetylglucosaminyldiphosphoundecaprenol N-acetyl-beta-D-mannosaminyltransferase